MNQIFVQIDENSKQIIHEKNKAREVFEQAKEEQEKSSEKQRLIQDEYQNSLEPMKAEIQSLQQQLARTKQLEFLAKVVFILQIIYLFIYYFVILLFENLENNNKIIASPKKKKQKKFYKELRNQKNLIKYQLLQMHIKQKKSSNSMNNSKKVKKLFLTLKQYKMIQKKVKRILLQKFLLFLFFLCIPLF